MFTHPPAANWDARITRADVLIREIADIEQEWIDGAAAELEHVVATDGRSVEVTLRMTARPSALFGVMAGEVIHLLRSALDNVAWHAVLVAHNGEDPDKPTSVSFPIEKSEADFEKERQRKLPRVDGEVLAAFTHVQPYCLGERAEPIEETPLQRLHSLSILDKHRQLQVSAWAPMNLMMGVGEGQRWRSTLGTPPFAADGDVVLRWDREDDSPEGEPPDCYGELRVTLADGWTPLDSVPLVDDLRALSSHVRWAVNVVTRRLHEHC